jgi:hypothetical protein
MSYDPSPQWRPAPEPQHELDRLLQLAPRDPSVHSKMFRLLWNLEEICIYVPPHPELEGEHLLSTDEGFTWCSFGDAEGSFAPVFTSVACADYALRNLPQRDTPLPMIASLPAKVLFKFLNDGHTTARILGAGGGQLSLPPQTVAALVAGVFPIDKLDKLDPPTSSPPVAKPAQQVRLHPVPAEVIPPELSDAISDLCEKSPVPLGIYVFHQEDPRTGIVSGNDLRFIVWLRHDDQAFIQDFCQLAQRLTPPHLQFFCKTLTSGDKKLMKFLQGRPTLWPVSGVS